MPAQALKFPELLQQTLDEGVLSPHQCWQLEWELTVLGDRPWSSPQVRSIGQLFDLFHLSPQESRPH